MEPGHVGRYALIRLIGHGGMADVWAGKIYGASGFEKVVAIKILSPDRVNLEEFQRALTDEAKLQVSLKHPNIVDIYDLNFEAENPYLVMEYIEGIELRKLLKVFRQKKIVMPMAIAAYICSEISKALSHAHERKNPQTGEPLHIVHRDVSPSNILISIHGDVKLSDFGIAKSAIQSSETQSGQIKGKFRYMSPEQASGTAIDSLSDIYSLGLVFFESLTGQLAYDDDSDMGVLKKARAGNLDLSGVQDPTLHKIISKLLQRKREERYQDLASFRKDLGEFLVQHGEFCDRETCSQYMESLDLPDFKEMMMVRRKAEKWNPESFSRLLDQTGQISVVKTIAPFPKKRNLWLFGSLIFLSLLSLMTGVWILHKSKQEAQPDKSVEELKVVPQKIQGLRVAFNAAPYAEVSIPGFFSNLVTPILSQKLPPGYYQVTFVHPPSGRQATAELKGTDGGSFVCYADMALNDAAHREPGAFCKPR